MLGIALLLDGGRRRLNVRHQLLDGLGERAPFTSRSTSKPSANNESTDHHRDVPKNLVQGEEGTAVDERVAKPGSARSLTPA
jgi:hypothetical protein